MTIGNICFSFMQSVIRIYDIPDNTFETDEEEEEDDDEDDDEEEEDDTEA